MQGAEKLTIRHTAKAKDSFGLKKIEDRNRQFLIEKIIDGIEFNKPYEISSEKKKNIIDTIEKNYRISRLVYQSLFVDVEDSFIEYIHLLDVDEIQQVDDDLRANGLGTKSLLEIENAYKLLTIFQMFYYFNRRLSLRNSLLIVPDGETAEGTEKINLKLLYEMFKDTKSHGLVSIQFLCVLGIFFGLHISIPKYAITELYKNLSYETLSGERDLEFEAISDLIGEMSFKIKNSTLSNIKRKSEQDKESNLDIKKSHDLFEEPTESEIFKEELEEDLYKDLEHEKIEEPYVEP